MNLGSHCLAISLCLLICTGCGTRSALEQGSKEHGKSDDANLFDTTQLQGRWRDSSDSTAIFSIVGDSLYYPDEQDAPYFISIEGSNVVLKQGEIIMSFEIKKITADSLIFHDPILGDDIKYHKDDDK